MLVVLDSLNLSNAERRLVSEAISVSNSIAEAAALLGVTRHALKRRMLKHDLTWPSENQIFREPQHNDNHARMASIEQQHLAVQRNQIPMNPNPNVGTPPMGFAPGQAPNNMHLRPAMPFANPSPIKRPR
jgi:hypothetical protein